MGTSIQFDPSLQLILNSVLWTVLVALCIFIPLLYKTLKYSGDARLWKAQHDLKENELKNAKEYIGKQLEEIRGTQVAEKEGRLKKQKERLYLNFANAFERYCGGGDYEIEASERKGWEWTIKGGVDDLPFFHFSIRPEEELPYLLTMDLELDGIDTWGDSFSDLFVAGDAEYPNITALEFGKKDLERVMKAVSEDLS